MIRRPPRSTRTAHSFPTRRSSDLRTVFYVENDPETPLTVRVKKHVLGTPVVDDELVYEEHDDSFYMGVDRTRDDRYICIGVESTVSSELRSEEHTSELQSLMRISYAVFCLKKKTHNKQQRN